MGRKTIYFYIKNFESDYSFSSVEYFIFLIANETESDTRLVNYQVFNRFQNYSLCVTMVSIFVQNSLGRRPTIIVAGYNSI